MRITCFCFGLAFVTLIANTLAFRPDEYDYSDYSDRPYRRISYYGVNKRDLSVPKLNIPIVDDGVQFAMRSVNWIMKVVRCLVSCFVDYLYKNVCNQMFPCLYDCFVGATFVSSAVEKKLKEINPFNEKRPPLGLKTVYVVMNCLKTCATGQSLTNWESFAYILYCVADQCVCYYVFGQ